jgi:hypothetical protein
MLCQFATSAPSALLDVLVNSLEAPMASCKAQVLEDRSMPLLGGDRCVRRPPRTSRSEVSGPRGKNNRRNIGYRLETVRNAWENIGNRQSN